ncbi:hypothetical protein M2352_004502 [Azospirillum fermentarium]|nr:hypothetical protein [Azospirillum fermentarium]MCW2248842.1 hypothetical protein [Azospirillum fermentarium]
MSRDLKSFKGDWRRWSAGERVFAVALLVGAVMTAGSPLVLMAGL